MITITIGRAKENDIVIDDITRIVSNNHAFIEIEENEIYITDTSTNGTFVNGKKLEVNKRIKIKFGAKVHFANKILLDWNLIPEPKPIPSNKIKRTIIFSVIAITIFIISILYITFKGNEKKEIVFNTQELYNKYNSAVVLVYQEFYYTIQVNNKTVLYIGLDEENKMVYNNEIGKMHPIKITGTGFFISHSGQIITNRHVAEPWNSENETKNNIRSSQIFNEVNTYINSNTSNTVAPKIQGLSTFIGIALNNSSLSKNHGFMECRFIKSHEIRDIDLALLQLRSENLPPKSTFIEINSIPHDSVYKIGSKAVIIGFPGGFDLQERQNSAILVNAITNEGTINQSVSSFHVMYQTPSLHGASGSPVFNDKGNLIAINYASGDINYNYGILAKFIKDLVK